MSEARAFDGMRAGEVLRRLLRARGDRSTEEEPGQTNGGTDSAESLLLGLESRGIAARVVRIRKGDLRFLEAPALIQLEDGSWLLLRAAGNGRRVIVEGRAGVQPVSVASLEANGSGVALQIVQELPPGRTLRRRLGTLLFAQRKVVSQAAAGGLIMMLLALIPPLLTRVIVDRALPGGSTSVVAFLAAVVVLVTFFQVWTGWLRARAILYLKARTETILGHGFLTHLLSLPFSYLSGKTRGQLLQGFMGLSNAQDVLTERALGAAFDGVMAILYLVVMVSLMPAPTLAVIVAALAMAALAIVAGRRQAGLQRKETEAQNEQRDFLVELLSGAATVKATGAEERSLSEWLRRLSREFSLALTRQRIGLWSGTGLETIRQMLTVILLVWGAGLVLEGQTTTGSLLAFLQMSTAFLGSVSGLTAIHSTIMILQPQLSSVTEALQRDSQPRRSGRVSPGHACPVALENVWFRYDPTAPWIVRELSLQVEVGEKRWIKGPSGSGKSTILRLIAGLYLPQRGTISVGGRDPAAANELMIYLPQFVYLYGGSILENLEIFSGHAKRQRLMEAAEASGLHALVSALPLGYETRLPPGGATLSGGERQLVALTSVMASDRGLFLLDEALANIDWVSRSWIEKSAWLDGKTMIYASHDAGFGSGSAVSLQPDEIT